MLGTGTGAPARVAFANKKPNNWGNQPPSPAVVNWSNPINKNVAAIFDTRAGVEICLGTKASNLSSVLTTSSGGLCSDFSSTANQQYPHRPQYAVTGPITVFILAEIRAFNNSTPLIIKGAGTTYTPYEVRSGWMSVGGAQLGILRGTTVGYGTGVVSTNIISNKGIGSVRALAVRRYHGNARGSTDLFVDGVYTLGAYEDWSGADAPVVDNGADVWIGRRSDGATQLDGRIYYIAVFARALQNSEIISLSNNPWQLFSPRSVQIPVSSGTSRNRPVLQSWAWPPNTPAVVNYDSWQSKGILRWWPLNGYTDEPINRNSGTLVSGAAFVEDIKGPALSLDGSAAYMQIPSSNIVLGNTFTFSAWIYVIGGLTTRQTIFGCDNLANAFQIEFGLYSGAIGAIYTGQEVTTSANGVCPLNIWTHITYTKNGVGATGAIYINGISQSLSLNTGSFLDGDTVHAVGRRTAASQLFNGKIQDVRLYNYVMSATQVLALSRNTLDLYQPRTIEVPL